MNKQTESIVKNYDEVLAASRARRAASINKHEDARRVADLLRVTGRRFTEDATMEALAHAISFNKRVAEAGAPDKQVDPVAFATKNARGFRSHEVRGRTRRAGREMKYADRWVPGDPTGHAAVRATLAPVLALADGYVSGITVDWTTMANDLGCTVSGVKWVAVGAVQSTLTYGRPLDARARTAGMRPADVVAAGNAFRG